MALVELILFLEKVIADISEMYKFDLSAAQGDLRAIRELAEREQHEQKGTT